MAKINRFATNEIEGQASAAGEINPLGMHYDTDGTIFFSNGAASSKKFIAPGKIYGSGSDSVSGKDTLKLIPDSDTFDSGTDQYIVIDAASPNGIHIRAGGGLNASTSSLYLGGEKNFIKIDEATNNITIGTGGTDVNTEWVFGGTGTLNYSTGLSFASPYPISFTANLNANSFVSTSSSASFDGGTDWSYEISITVGALGTVTVNVDAPTFTSNIGYKDGDTFRFGTAIHGIRGFDLDLTLQNITQITTGPDTFVANLVPAAIPPLESTITSAKPVKITSGTSNFILGTDGSIRFENGALLSEVTQASRNAFRLRTAQDTDAALYVYTTTSGGNSAVITTTSLADEALVIGESNQSIRFRNDGNIDIATVNRDTAASTTWKLTSLGRIASQDDSLYLQQSTFEFTDPGLFYSGSNNLRLSAANDVIITAGGTSNFRFTGSNEIKFENNSVVTGTTWLGTYPALKLTTDLNNPDLGLAFYTSTGSGNVVYVAPVNGTVSGMAVGTSQHQFKLAQEGDSSILSRTGTLADVSSSIAASRGGNVYITAGAAGDNAGDPNFGAEGGHLFLESGYSTLTDVAGGSIVLKTGSGYGGFGNVKIEISDKTWTFDKTGNVKFPDGSLLSTAPLADRLKSGNAEVILVTSGPQPYVLFPAGTTGAQLQIVESELSTAAGNLALTSSEDTYLTTNGNGSIPGGSKLWIFDKTGNIILPQTAMNVSPAPISLPGITWTDGTFQTGKTIELPQNQIFEIRFNSTGPGPSGSGNLKIDRNRLTTTSTGFSVAYPDGSYFNFNSSQKRIQYSDSNGYISFGSDTRNQTGHGNDIEIKSYGDGTNGNVYIAAGVNPTNTRWAFQQSGNILFPDTTQQSTAWTGAAAQVQSTPPASPTTGQLYYDTDDGRTYIYTGSAWIDASPTGVQLTWQQVDLTAGSDVSALYLTSSSPEYTYVTTSNESRNIRLPSSIGLVKGRRFVVRNSGNAGLPIQTSTGTAFNISIYQNQTMVATVANVAVNGTTSWMLDIQGSALTGSGAHVMAFSPTITSPTLSGITKIGGVQETFTNLINATGVINHDCSTTSVFRHTTPSSNWTANFINMYLAGGSVTAVSLIIVQGATGYYPDAVQIQGAAQTINWQGNQTPTPSTNRTDIVTFSILNNSGTYTVFGQLTGF